MVYMARRLTIYRKSSQISKYIEDMVRVDSFLNIENFNVELGLKTLLKMKGFQYIQIDT